MLNLNFIKDVNIKDKKISHMEHFKIPLVFTLSSNYRSKNVFDKFVNS